MSCYMKSSKDTTITIPNNVDINGITYYNILVTIGNVHWTVRHRYSEFVDLHLKLINEQSIGRDLLPPKKVIGNRSPQFLVQRQKDLEIYLKNVLIFLQYRMCREFIEFLELNKYDIIYLLQDLAHTFFNQSELLLQFFNKRYEFSALEMYAISERLKQPRPDNDISDKIYDFSHVIDFCLQIERLIVRPKNKRITETTSFYLDQNTSIGTSNIIPNNLKFDLIAFKNLKSIQIHGLPVSNVTNTGTIRQTITTFSWQNTNATQLNEFLLCDSVHKNDIDNDKYWHYLDTLNLSNNKINSIDTSLKLVKNLKTLILDQNNINTIENVACLPYLQTLSLCENNFTILNDLHLQLGGNLMHLNLSQNNITTLNGFQKLFTLIRLDISCNGIDDINQVDFIAKLPCLEEIILTGNPIAGTVDYRSRILARFDERCNEIYLDNEKGNQHEIDTALALSALKLSETFSPLLQSSNNQKINFNDTQ